MPWGQRSAGPFAAPMPYPWTRRISLHRPRTSQYADRTANVTARHREEKTVNESNVNGGPIDDKSLSAYLHSHLIAAAAGERLFEQAAKSWNGTPHGATLSHLAAEVSADKAALHEISDQLHLHMPAYKKPLSWISSQLGTLDPLNPLHSPDGASGQLALEGLLSAVTGKSLLWKTLMVLSRTDERIDPATVNRLLDRANEQIRELDALLLDSTPERFAKSDG